MMGKLQDLLAKRDKLTERDRELERVETEIEEIEAQQEAEAQAEAERAHQEAVHTTRVRRDEAEQEIAELMQNMQVAISELEDAEHELSKLKGYAPPKRVPSRLRHLVGVLLDKWQRENPEILGGEPKDGKDRYRAILVRERRAVERAKNMHAFYRKHNKETHAAGWAVRYRQAKRNVADLEARQ